MNFHLRKILFLTFSVLSILGYGFFVFAAPPGPGGYNPGETLDPECTPGQLLPEPCIVQLTGGGSVTADNGLTVTGSNVQLGGTLLQDTVIDQNGNDFLVTDGDYFFGKVTDISTILPFPLTDPFIGSGYLNTNTGDYFLDGFINNPTGYYFLQMQKNGFTHSMQMTGDNDGFEFSSAETDYSTLFKLGSARVQLGYRDNITNDYLDINMGNDGISFSSESGTYRFPRADGTVNQILSTDGAGQISWVDGGWSLTGNSGTTVGTNFIGTTDAVDFEIKTNGIQIALFGQNGNVAIGGDSVGFGLDFPQATAANSFAVGPGSVASNSGPFPLGTYAIGALAQSSNSGSVAIGTLSNASGIGSVALLGSSSGQYALSFGQGATSSATDTITLGRNSQATAANAIAIGSNSNSSFGARAFGPNSFAIGNDVQTNTCYEIAMGVSTTIDGVSGCGSLFRAERLFSIGNGDFATKHNAYTLWKDGSFAYNDDNFQNDNPGTEQNMFYFNYGNHNGLGAVQTKRAVRLGSALSGEWDVDNIFVGDRSVAIGFAAGPSLNGPIARGAYSIALGTDTVASGTMSTAFGVRTDATGSEATAFGNSNMASGDNSTAFGPAGAIASGLGSIAFGNNAVASGRYTIAFGGLITARSYSEIAYGIQNTLYTPASTTLINGADRLVVIGNGNVIPGDPNEFSDAFTILKSGQTGIGIDNFEANTNGNIFQVGDGSTNIIGYVDDTTGNWVAVSDEHKKDNITDLSYGLNELIQLRPTSFNYKRNG
jgi:hypothetical protein